MAGLPSWLSERSAMNVHDPGERLVAAIDLVTEQAELMTDGD